MPLIGDRDDVIAKPDFDQDFDWMLFRDTVDNLNL
jgi:hypothetical protein